jgi:hypothetical protein
MSLEIVTLKEFNTVVGGLLKKIDTLEAMIKPFVESERDGKKVLTRDEATLYCRLSLYGINAARREGRIAGVKINEKSFGYTRDACDNYLKRYRKG